MPQGRDDQRKGVSECYHPPIGLTGNDVSASLSGTRRTCVRVVRSHRVTRNIQYVVDSEHSACLGPPYKIVCVAERKSCRVRVGGAGKWRRW